MVRYFGKSFVIIFHHILNGNQLIQLKGSPTVHLRQNNMQVDSNIFNQMMINSQHQTQMKHMYKFSTEIMDHR
jgi:hypothetical protein